MESIGRKLEILRSKITQKVESTPIFLSDMLLVLPELQKVPINVLTAHDKELMELYENRLMCGRCTASRDESKCCQLVADYEKSIIRVSARRCQKQEQQRLIKRIDALSEQSKIGKRFQNRRFETFGITQENKAAYERCYHYAQQFVPNSEGLLLIGGVGTGKTHLSVAIMHELMKKNIYGLFITVPDLLQKIRSGFDKKNEQAEAFMQAIQRAQLLILDDLGAEKNNEWTQEQLYMIVNARYESMLPTIITSNCSVEELKIRIGTRSVSRIIEMCDGVICKGLDYREKNRM